MENRSAPPASSSSCTAVGIRRRRAEAEEYSGGDLASCTGRSCGSCTAGVIADCVALCCCPCGVVSILALAFLKLPWAVARRCIAGRRGGRRRRRVLEGNSGKAAAALGSTAPYIGAAAIGGGAVDGDFGDEIRAEDVWLELSEVGHLGFGRVSFTGVHEQGQLGKVT
ncbi:NADH-dependent glutamate synthase 1 [Striga asiatica]|uniref:NADH-dependent glutamate synthase 1 n=1 Tax=Striga asiatica TaxID=4170 RepID=A0A5A7P9F2_STRAF|nr:NADH-dependent glutamate synthase 1 [Striga asiatica]